MFIKLPKRKATSFYLVPVYQDVNPTENLRNQFICLTENIVCTKWLFSDSYTLLTALCCGSRLDGVFDGTLMLLSLKKTDAMEVSAVILHLCLSLEHHEAVGHEARKQFSLVSWFTLHSNICLTHQYVWIFFFKKSKTYYNNYFQK